MISGAARDQKRIDLSITAKDSLYSESREPRVTGHIASGVRYVARRGRVPVYRVNVPQVQLPCSADQSD
jgi:hypothetical protein